MKASIKTVTALALGLAVGDALAYGSSSSSGHCDKPIFSEFQPAPNKYLQSFTEFSFIASSNTTTTSIVANISAGSIQYHLSAKELKFFPLKNGQTEVRGKLPRPIEHGFARLSVTAHSKPGCEKTDGYLLRIQ